VCAGLGTDVGLINDEEIRRVVVSDKSSFMVARSKFSGVAVTAFLYKVTALLECLTHIQYATTPLATMTKAISEGAG